MGSLTWPQHGASSWCSTTTAAPCEGLHVRLKRQVQAACLCCWCLLLHPVIVNSTHLLDFAAAAALEACVGLWLHMSRTVSVLVELMMKSIS